VNVYLYWRVQQDLNCLGEALHFHDPALIRSLRRWVRRNLTGLTMAENFLESSTTWFSRN
jgi:hypothetical protein